jgi:hypothetical protein
MKNGWQAPLAALVVIILFAAFNLRPVKEAADVAAWVQGVGSLLAIVAAVGIYARQYAEKKADDALETRAFVQAVHDEIATLWEGYSQNLRLRILGLQQGQVLDAISPMNPDAFVIYNNASAQVGRIDDAALRTLIVTVYARARGFIYSIQMHNGLLIDFRQFETYYQGADRQARLNQRRDVVVRYAEGLRQIDAAIEALVTQCLAAAERWLAEHPPC